MDIVTRQQLNILIHLSKKGTTKGKYLIHRIADESNFPEDELRRLMHTPEPIGSLGALSSNQRFEYLYSIVEMMILDKVEVQKELLFCDQLALDLGFNKDAIAFIRQEIERSEKKQEIKRRLQSAF